MRSLVLVLLPLTVGCTYDFDAYTPIAGDPATRPDGAVTTDAASTGCTEPGGKSVGGKCYFPTSGALVWSAAKAACEAAGAHLVTITSGVEEAIVEPIGAGDRWLGISRPAGSPSRAASFVWLTGEPATYLKWGSGQPSGAGECGKLRASGSWADASCADTLVGLCER